MKKTSQPAKEKATSKQHPPLKPKNPNTKGAPDDKDPSAQYEDKDES